jgi:hypothetical protein
MGGGVMAIETYPENLGEMVRCQLADGNEVMAYWDGLQWWVGLENDDQDAPIINEFVVSWSR